MPEGDTVWLTAQRLDRALAGRALTLSDFRVPALATTDLRGATVTEVVARGKHLLTRFDTGSTLHSHLRMDGSWFITRQGERPQRYPAHMIRVQLGNAEWTATGYRVHDLELVPTTQEDTLVGHLGPDLLGDTWDRDEAVRRLAAQPEVAIGEALLDQRNLAGIGNLYKSEVLFLRGIDPWARTGTVTDLTAVVDLARDLLRRNRDHPEQSTTGSLRRGEQHWVYRGDGQPCRRCRTPIQRRDQGRPPNERSTYWCPSCQPTISATEDPPPARRDQQRSAHPTPD